MIVDGLPSCEFPLALRASSGDSRDTFSYPMKMRLPVLLVLLIASVCGGRGEAAKAEWVSNPIMPRHADPHCVRHTDGHYYFTGSVPAYDRIEVLKAPTLQGLALAEPVVVWRKHASGAMGGYIWAPEIHFIDGKWYIYFAAGDSTDLFKIRMYVLENASPDPTQGAWVEKGEIKTRWDSFSLDATTFTHRGKRYLVWAQRDPAIKSSSNLYISEMENPWTLKGPQVMLTQPELPWEIVKYKVNEGAAVLIRNGRVFVTYSGSATDSRYCMGLLTAAEDADLLDVKAWTKSPTPVFQTSEENRAFGPGHNCFTVAADGVTDVMLYHSRTYREIHGDSLRDPNRQTRVQRFTWAADGTPVFGVPVADGWLTLTEPKAEGK